MKDKGFTLLELLVVLFIIGVAAAFIVPNIAGSLANLKLKTATKHLGGILRYARSKAVSNKKTAVVVINIDNASYSAEIPQIKTAQEDVSKPVFFPKEVKFRQITINGETITSDIVKLRFYPKGNTSGGEIILENERGRMYKITIDTLVGKVKNERITEDLL